jgi:phenolic acid decarboxylase
LPVCIHSSREVVVSSELVRGLVVSGGVISRIMVLLCYQNILDILKTYRDSRMARPFHFLEFVAKVIVQAYEGGQRNQGVLQGPWATS